MNLASFVVGLLTLAALEVVTSSDAAANRAALIPASIAGAVRRLMDPTIALIPNWHDTGADAPPTTSAGIGAAGVPTNGASAGMSLHKGADAAAGFDAFNKEVAALAAQPPTKARR